jgi:hypothetical protein
LPTEEGQWDGAGEGGERVTKKYDAESMVHVPPVAFLGWDAVGQSSDRVPQDAQCSGSGPT